MALDASALARSFASKRIVKTDKTPERAQPAPRGKPKEEKPPPSAPEIEKAALACILSDPETGFALFERTANERFFTFPAQEWYRQMRTFYRDKGFLDAVVFIQNVLDNPAIFTPIGGHVWFATELQAYPQHADLLPIYVGQLRETYLKRAIQKFGFAIAGDASSKDSSQDPVKLLDRIGGWYEDLQHMAGGPNGSVRFSHEGLTGFDAAHDPNVLLGHRWLCRGFTSLLAGPAGAGKSSLAIQMAMYWGCGYPFCGIKPPRPLKSLMLQAENDLGDAAEPYQGVIAGINRHAEFELDEALIQKNVVIEWVIDKMGGEFCNVLDEMIQLHRPDIAWIDPMFAFAGCDLLKPKETTDFIRHGLFPIAVKRKVALFVVHHIGKSYKDNTEKDKWTDLDFQYLGFGTSEIQNAFRAVTILLPASISESNEKVFRLILSKRGNRAGARDTEGHHTSNIYLTHAPEGIFWMQTAKPETKGGRPKETSPEEILEAMSVVNGWDTTELFQHMKKETGMKERTFYRLWSELKKGGKIRLDGDKKWIKN